ncbi:MAG TPA: hypothetical protein VLM76_00810 [Patescibacteria group bacterium]|nr:hypothetical protein [Patescibacteria group bacterium]
MPGAAVAGAPGSATPPPPAATTAPPAPPAAASSPRHSPAPGAVAALGGSGAGGPGTATHGPGSDASGSLTTLAAVAGPFGDDELARLILLTGGVSTTVTLVAAFLLFGRRRRDDDSDDSSLAAAAGAAYGGPLAVAPAVIRPLGIDPGTGGTDIDLPRWRRPSLLAARKFDPIRSADTGAGTRLAFASGTALAGMERRLVRYRIVRLLDRPDELTGGTVGSLDEGDQVAVLEQHGLYRRVETPDGRTGWLHKMTLGDVIADPDPADAEVDSDVLKAYLAARGRG